jgi:hypothetical protein
MGGRARASCLDTVQAIEAHQQRVRLRYHILAVQDHEMVRPLGHVCVHAPCVCMRTL